MLDFVRHYPLKHYARTFLRSSQAMQAAFLAQPDRVACLVPVGSEFVFKDKLEKLAGALSLTVPAKNAAGFFNAFTSKERVDGGHWVVAVDTPQFAAEVIDASLKPAFQTLTQLKRLTDPRQLIEYLDQKSAKRFVFEAVGLNLQPLTDEALPKKYLYLGLDRDIQGRLEAWFRLAGQHLSAIVPMQVAALLGARSVCPKPGLHVVATPHSTTIGLFNTTGLVDCAFTMALGEGVPYEDVVGGMHNMALQLAPAAEGENAETAGSTAVLDDLQTFFFGCGFTPLEVDSHVSRFRREGLAMEAVRPQDFAVTAGSPAQEGPPGFEARLLGALLGTRKGTS
ncbi:MAG TPA: hypothetical protein VGD78_22420 [Chthoniobacterales bacterium]